MKTETKALPGTKVGDVLRDERMLLQDLLLYLGRISQGLRYQLPLESLPDDSRSEILQDLYRDIEIALEQERRCFEPSSVKHAYSKVLHAILDKQTVELNPEEMKALVLESPARILLRELLNLLFHAEEEFKRTNNPRDVTRILGLTRGNSQTRTKYQRALHMYYDELRSIVEARVADSDGLIDLTKHPFPMVDEATDQEKLEALVKVKNWFDCLSIMAAYDMINKALVERRKQGRSLFDVQILPGRGFIEKQEG